MNVLFFDTETTGLPEWKKPSGDPSQPHITQICGALFQGDDRVLASINVMVKPEGWSIPDDLQKMCGFTEEEARMLGIPEPAAFELIERMILAADTVVAHNTNFDMRIIRIAAKRYADESRAEAIKSVTKECTMRQSTKIIGGKWPKLGEAYKHFFNEPLTGAHNAMKDVMACRRIWLHMRDMREAA